MFDVKRVMQELGIKKADLKAVPRANHANRANPEREISTFSTVSTPSCLKNESSGTRKCCMWEYKLNTKLPGFTQMGLMTDDPIEAQRLLTAIYGRPVSGLKIISKKHQSYY